MKVNELEKPVLTMPEDAQNVLRENYEAASVILEYGSGGSTVLASEMQNKTVFSVESDRSWTRKMRRWFRENPPNTGTEVNISWVDIGDTKKWGFPANQDKSGRYPRYPLSIWQSEGFKHPDVVLVDGRFRVGCALATAFNITRPVTLLFDDYGDRPRMQAAEEFLDAPELVGRMAIFRIEPMQIPADRLIRVIRLLTVP